VLIAIVLQLHLGIAVLLISAHRPTCHTIYGRKSANSYAALSTRILVNSVLNFVLRCTLRVGAFR